MHKAGYRAAPRAYSTNKTQLGKKEKGFPKIFPVLLPLQDHIHTVEQIQT